MDTDNTERFSIRKSQIGNRGEVLALLKSESDEDALRSQREYGEIRTLNVQEKAIVRDNLTLIADKLNEYGLNGRVRVPTLEDVVVMEVKIGGDIGPDTTVGGDVGLFGDKINMAVVEGVKISHPDFYQTLSHEVGHYITKQVIQLTTSDWQKLRSLGRGFSRGDAVFKNYSVLDESLMELFSADCVSADGEFKMRYPSDMLFVHCMLERMAVANGTQVIDEFRKLFFGYVTRDFDYYKHLVDTWQKVLGGDKSGLRFAKKLNSIRSIVGYSDFSQMVEVAKLGGFDDKFGKGVESLGKGDEISLEGFKGKFKVDPVLLE